MGRAGAHVRRHAVVVLLVALVLAGAVEGLAPHVYAPFHVGVLVATGMTLGYASLPLAALVVALGLAATGSLDAQLALVLVLDTAVAALATSGMERVGGRHGPGRSLAVVADMIAVTVAAATVRVLLLAVVGRPAGLQELVLTLIGLHLVLPGLRVLALRVPLVRRGTHLSRALPDLLLAVFLTSLIVLYGPESLLAVLALLGLAFLVALRWGYPFITAGGAVVAALLHGSRLFLDVELLRPSWIELLVIDLLLLGILAAATEMERFRDMLAERDVSFASAASGLLVATVDQPWTVERGNASARELCGVDPVGRTLEELLGHDVVEVLRAAVDDEPSRARLRLEPAGEQAREVEVAATRIPVSGLRGDRVYVELVDVTDLTRATAALRSVNEELHGVARTIAHDLAQPLAAVAGFASTIRAHHDRLDPGMRDQLLERLEAAAVGVQDRVVDIVASAASAGRAPSPVPLRPVLGQLEASLSLADADWTLTLDLSVESVVAERGMLTSVIGNLIDNAVKHGGDGTVGVHVLSSRLRGGTLLRVTDDGPGIPAARLAVVLEPGVRLHPATADGQGAGLATARRQAERAGCQLQALPHPDGARFELWVPDGSGRRPLHVLVAQADREACRLLRGLLAPDTRVRDVGSVTTVEDLTAAMAVARPDVLLLDPALGGGAAVADLARVTAGAPDVTTILMASESALTGLSDLANELGVHVALDAAELDAELVRLLDEPPV